MDRPCYLYHICRAADKYNFSVGYIGISTRPSKRWASGGYKDNPHLSSALKLYNDVIRYVVIVSTVKGCLRREAKLRPTKNIGWNIAAGGGMPPSPKGSKNCISNLPKEKRRTDYTCSDAARENMRLAQSKRSGEFRERMLKNNPSKGRTGKEWVCWKGWYITPSGKYVSRSEAALAHGVSGMTITRRCVNGGIVGHSRFTPKEWVGKTWLSLGWGFESVDKERDPEYAEYLRLKNIFEKGPNA